MSWQGRDWLYQRNRQDQNGSEPTEVRGSDEASRSQRWEEELHRQDQQRYEMVRQAENENDPYYGVGGF